MTNRLYNAKPILAYLMNPSMKNPYGRDILNYNIKCYLSLWEYKTSRKSFTYLSWKTITLNEAYTVRVPLGILQLILNIRDELSGGKANITTNSDKRFHRLQINSAYKDIKSFKPIIHYYLKEVSKDVL
jgi:hypothetical protein